MRLSIEQIAEPEDREHQSEVVRLINEARLCLRDDRLAIRIRDPAEKYRAFGIAACFSGTMLRTR